MKYLIVISFIFASCKKDQTDPPGSCRLEERIGCVCNDGSWFAYPAGKPYAGQCDRFGGLKNYMCN